jgi:hypothetical protein
MTSIHPDSLGKRSASAGVAFLVLLGTTLALAAATACSDDETTTPVNYIGATNATHPRLGASGDADSGAPEARAVR